MRPAARPGPRCSPAPWPGHGGLSAPLHLPRRALLAQAAAWGTALAAPALLGACAAAARPRPANAAFAQPRVLLDGAVLQLAPGVYAWPGLPGETDAPTRGRTSNAGFLVGPDGVLVIDSGVSHAHGLARLASLRQITQAPLRGVVLTQPRQEFLFGATAFQQAGAPLWMHRRAAQVMTARCGNCLRTLKRLLGDAEMAGTQVPTVDHLFDGDLRLDLIGRPILLRHHGHSSGPGDLSVHDAESGVVFAGGLAAWQRVPDIQDSDDAGWRAALAALEREAGSAVVVPGFGRVPAPGALWRRNRDYLQALDDRVRQLLKEGRPLSEVADAAMLEAYADWDQVETVHRRNASMRYVRLERALFQTQ